MITCLTSAHSIFTEPRFTEMIAGSRAMKLSTVCPFLSAQLGIDLSLEDQLEMAGMILTIQSLHICPDHRIFEFAHVLYHLAETADGPLH